MRIEVKVIKEDDQDTRHAHVELHARRGDGFNVERTATVEADGTDTFMVPDGGRLVVNSPLVHEKAVYDREQGAAIMPSQQRRSDTVADKAVEDVGMEPQGMNTPPKALNPAAVQTGAAEPNANQNTEVRHAATAPSAAPGAVNVAQGGAKSVTSPVPGSSASPSNPATKQAGAGAGTQEKK